jgi:hypothetical protein
MGSRGCCCVDRKADTSSQLLQQMPLNPADLAQLAAGNLCYTMWHRPHSNALDQRIPGQQAQ